MVLLSHRITNRVRAGFVAIAVLSVIASCQRTAPGQPEFDASRVLPHVEAQCAFGPRVPNSAARDSAAAYISRACERFGATVSVQAFNVDDSYGDRTLRLMNLVASFHPERVKRVMLAAHYDCRPRADEDPDSTLRDQAIDGAVDSAAGVGILLELARLIGRQAPPEVGVDLVFFDGEDYGKPDDLQHYLLGSRHFAANLNGYRPACGVLLDMVGGVGTSLARERYSMENASAVTDTLFTRASAMGLNYFTAHNGPAIYDDHVPLLQAGIPMTDLFGYGYRHWHTTSDTPDKVDPVLVQEVGRLLVDFVYRFPF